MVKPAWLDIVQFLLTAEETVGGKSWVLILEKVRMASSVREPSSPQSRR